MADYREELLCSIVNALVLRGYETKQILDIKNILIDKISNYEITERCTDLMVVETQSEQLIKYFVATLLTEGKSKKTAYNYRNLIMRFYHDINKPLIEAQIFDFRWWLSQMMKSVCKRTCNMYRSYLSSFYKFLSREEYIPRNPMEKISTIKFTKTIKKAFDPEDLEKLRNVCDTRIRAEFELLLSCGARAQELCDMNLDDIDWTKNSIIIHKGKGNKSRLVYFDRTTAYYLKEYLNNRKYSSNALFTTRGNVRLSTQSLRKDLKKIGKLAQVDNVHPHRARFHFATEKYRKGMDLRTLQKLLGHTSIEVTVNNYIGELLDKVQIDYLMAI